MSNEILEGFHKVCLDIETSLMPRSRWPTQKKLNDILGSSFSHNAFSEIFLFYVSFVFCLFFCLLYYSFLHIQYGFQFNDLMWFLYMCLCIYIVFLVLFFFKSPFPLLIYLAYFNFYLVYFVIFLMLACIIRERMLIWGSG